jgi:hypothetical protein
MLIRDQTERHDNSPAYRTCPVGMECRKLRRQIAHDTL